MVVMVTGPLLSYRKRASMQNIQGRIVAVAQDLEFTLIIL